MEQITFEDYKAAVLRKFKDVQQQDRTSLLQNLTPASIRKYCTLLVNQKLSADDENTLRAYFNVAPESNLEKGIEYFGLGKMKSLISFLNSDQDSHNSLRTELTAILADFEPRPYSNFLKKNGAISQIFQENSMPIATIEEQEKDDERKGNAGFVAKLPSATTQYSAKNKLLLGSIIVLILLISIIAFKKVRQPDCLQWAEDHFEIVDCDGNKQGFVYVAPKLKYDENLLKLRKVEISDSTTFFKNGFPMVWYLKRNGTCEFFNAPGMHPVYDKPLKPVTQYIVNKYGKRKL